jgi:hypothetical protein
MRPSMIVVCLLMLATARALGCDEYTTEATRDLATGHRIYFDAGAEESSMMAARMAGAGVAAMALVVLASRAYERASSRRMQPLGPEPSSPIARPVDPRVRVDAGHDRAAGESRAEFARQPSEQGRGPA